MERATSRQQRSKGSHDSKEKAQACIDRINGLKLERQQKRQDYKEIF